jgi:hypothetical protein
VTDEVRDEAIVITLGSRTVFWIGDLDMPPSYLQKLRNDNRLGENVGAEIEEWLQNNSKHPANIWAEGVWFADLQDAALFKLFWHGHFS